jgi:hypothetical protein
VLRSPTRQSSAPRSTLLFEDNSADFRFAP